MTAGTSPPSTEDFSPPGGNSRWAEIAQQVRDAHPDQHVLQTRLKGLDSTDVEPWINAHLPTVLSAWWQHDTKPLIATLTKLFSADHHDAVTEHYVRSRQEYEKAHPLGMPDGKSVRELGSGTFGIVELWKNSLGQERAVKFDRWHNEPAANPADSEGLNTVRSEADHIVTIHHAGLTSSGRRYLVMEYLSGGTLADRLRASSGQPLATEEAVRLALEILTCLRSVHERGIIHNDLKPSNLMFDAKGILKLTDFGGARTVDEIFERPDQIRGVTPAYLAPERWRGERETVETDLFAVGAILFEMLTGRRCFDRKRRDELEEQICNTPMVSPRSLNSAIPQEIDDVVRRALSKDRDDRFHSAQEFLDALRPPTENEKVSLRRYNSSTLPGYHSDYYREPRPGVFDDIRKGLWETHLVNVIGPPGSGKSLTASEFASQSSYPYRFWINAETETGLIDSLAKAQRTLLGMTATDKDDVAGLARGFLEGLPTLTGWLLVYDNVTDVKLLEAWFPKSPTGNVLITSQSDLGRTIDGRRVAAPVELDEFAQEVAEGFFLQRAGMLADDQDLSAAKPADVNDVRALLHELGRLPLAVEAAAHVVSLGTSIAGYREELHRQSAPSLWGDGEFSTATKHVGLHKALQTLFERVQARSPEAGEALRDSAWLDPDGVPRWLFPNISERVLSELRTARLWQPVSSVSDASTSERTEGVETLFRMHREHQLHLRGMLNEAECWPRLRSVIARFQIPDDWDLGLWGRDDRTGRWFTGLLANLKHVLRELEQISPRLLSESDRSPLVETRVWLCLATGWVVRSADSNYAEAETLFRRACTEFCVSGWEARR